MVSYVVLLILVLVDVPDAERVPQGGGVPQAGVQHAFNGVPGHVRGGEGKETWKEKLILRVM